MKNIRIEEIEKIEKRYYNRIGFTNSLSINQEPCSKRGMNNNEKEIFRYNLIHSCQSHYNKDLALSIHFVNVEKNPPSLHKLVKNYLDLMHKAMSVIDNHSELLFVEDSQIRYLSASQNIIDPSNPHCLEWILEENNSKVHGSVWFETMDFSFFTELVSDAKLIRDSPNKDYVEGDSGCSRFDEYKKTKKSHQSNIILFGEKSASSILEYQKFGLQQEYMENFSIPDRVIFNLLESDIGLQKKSWSNSIAKIVRLSLKNYFSIRISIGVNKIPCSDGDSKIYVSSIKSELKKFKNKLKFLFPLTIPISVFVVFTPPKGYIKDLDNILIKIFPLVIEEFEPPTEFTSKTEDKKIGIMKYEALRVQSSEDDPEGSIQIFIKDCINGKDFWSSCKDTIEKVIKDENSIV